MSNSKVYENILVSGVRYDFSRHPHEAIPRRLLADWTELVCKIAKAVEPAFSLPEFPESFEFTTELIHSDYPYPSDENYYTLDLVYFDLNGSENHGIRISFENGRRSGDDSIEIETTKYFAYDQSFLPSYLVSAHIPKAATSPSATFYVWHEAEETPEIEDIFARHREGCLAPPTN